MKITFLGDIMCKQQMLKVYRTEKGYDFSEIFDDLKEYFKESTIVIANLETPISKKEENLTKEKYCFASPYEFAKAVYDAGIKCVSTANNHCLDRGVEGINETIKCLDEIGIIHTGTFDSKIKEPLILNIDGIQIGILSYTYGTNAFANKNYLNRKNKYCVNLFQNQELSNPITRYCFHHKNILARIYNKIISIKNGKVPIYERKENDFNTRRRLKKDINKTKEAGAEVIILLSHMGGQYNEKATKRTKNLSKFLLKSGVNIVVGNHEHVVHGGKFDDLKNNKLITYSLGNFDGIAGVYEEPFDKMSEYSIAWNIYMENTKDKVTFSRTTFSVLKTIKTENGGIKTVLVYDLINRETNKKNKQELIDDMFEIAYRFSSTRYKKIEKEFLI